MHCDYWPPRQVSPRRVNRRYQTTAEPAASYELHNTCNFHSTPVPPPSARLPYLSLNEARTSHASHSDATRSSSWYSGMTTGIASPDARWRRITARVTPAAAPSGLRQVLARLIHCIAMVLARVTAEWDHQMMVTVHYYHGRDT